MSTTIEEASKCPKCGFTGDIRGDIAVKDKPGYHALSIFCGNERCEWFGTPWIVQKNPDGSVPEAQDHQDRTPHTWPAENSVLFNQRRNRIMTNADEINRIMENPRGELRRGY